MDLDKDNYYHLCGKEQCQEKRCDEGEICIFKKGNDQCSKDGTDECGIHEKQKKKMCYDDKDGKPQFADVATTECERLSQGYTPRFTTTSKDVCKKGMLIYSCLL